jgi:tRNA(adenine34) deaminase
MLASRRVQFAYNHSAAITSRQILANQLHFIKVQMPQLLRRGDRRNGRRKKRCEFRQKCVVTQRVREQISLGAPWGRKTRRSRTAEANVNERPKDIALMQLALAEAAAAAKAQEAPVGAVIVDENGEILAKAGNSAIRMNDPTAHAEILCLRQAAQKIGNYRLTGASMVVTLEPCIMCVGAIIQARLARVVFGAFDPKAGALSTHLDGARLPFSNHHFETVGGVLEQECAEILRGFFRARRKQRSESASEKES